MFEAKPWWERQVASLAPLWPQGPRRVRFGLYLESDDDHGLALLVAVFVAESSEGSSRAFLFLEPRSNS